MAVANEADDSYAAGLMFETVDGGETWTALVVPSAVDDNGDHESENTLVYDILLPPEEPGEVQASARSKLTQAAAKPGIRSEMASSAARFVPRALGTQAGAASMMRFAGRRSGPAASGFLCRND